MDLRVESFAIAPLIEDVVQTCQWRARVFGALDVWLNGGEVGEHQRQPPAKQIRASVTATDPPLYGTCTSSMPAMLRKSSVAR